MNGFVGSVHIRLLAECNMVDLMMHVGVWIGMKQRVSSKGKQTNF